MVQFSKVIKIEFWRTAFLGFSIDFLSTIDWEIVRCDRDLNNFPSHSSIVTLIQAVVNGNPRMIFYSTQPLQSLVTC